MRLRIRLPSTLPGWVQSGLRIATGWIPGAGSAVEEALQHLNEHGERRSTLASLLDFDDHVWRPDSSPAALLRADVGVVPFHGRVPELGDLVGWCYTDEPLRLRLFTAPGGFGKTRLLRHFVRVRREHGWDGRFLREGRLDEKGIKLLFAETGAPLLIVIDYAESRRGEVEAVVRAARASQRKVRVVLLARAEGDWWSELKRAADGVGDFFQGPAVDLAPLGPLTDSPEARRDSFERALEAFATTLGKPVPEIVVPDLSDEDFGRVLLIHATALAAVEGEHISSVDLLDWLLNRERRGVERVRRQQAGLGDELQRGIEHAAALVTLAQGADSLQQTLEIVSCVPALAGQPRARVERIAELLHVLYGGRRWCDGVEPDLVGEHLVSACLHQAPELLPAAFGEGVPEARIEAGLTVLNRLAQRRPAERRLLQHAIGGVLERAALPAMRVAIAGGDPIGVVLAEALARSANVDVACQLDNRLPHHTVALREVAVEVDQMILDQLRATESEERDSETVAMIAARANNLSNRLADLGRREQALDAVREAVALFRELASAQPDAFLDNLATSLNSLSNRLTDLGRREEALEAIREAGETRRELATARPELFRNDFAGSLNNLSNCLADLGLHEEALAAIENAVEIHRDLATPRPDAFRADLARSLNNLAAHLSILGRGEEALVAIRECVEIRRLLATARPDAFRPDLASSLNNISAQLANLGHHEEALVAIRECVEIRRDLATARPNAFSPSLAGSLSNLSNRLADAGRDKAALDIIRESVGIQRELATAHPDTFCPDLAKFISVLHDRLREVGDIPGALVVTNEALDILDPYFRRHPAAFAGLMTAIVNDCEETAEAAGVEPDRARLAAIREILAHLQQDADG